MVQGHGATVKRATALNNNLGNVKQSSRLVPPSSRAAALAHKSPESKGQVPLLANESIKDFLMTFPKTQWPAVLEVG